ncbi:UTRA domain-containing protein [Streptomyces bauhiniae]|uniref:UTRA domain-containing protein n=1 Tax=Streptomyces bauhiniae TaxID=2340725 RepID=A0A4Z1DG79_9ACTN|nr:UTRA domain-containing protein [Streptomyces bauhiniae]TGN81638.1 UTRA domain-containing protein [Streptomyces bauhiniae]
MYRRVRLRAAPCRKPQTLGGQAGPVVHICRSRKQVTVCAEVAPDHVSAVMDLGDDEQVCVRRRRFVLAGKPVLLAPSYLPMSLVAGSAITQEETGPGGTYARLAKLGYKPVHFLSRMPSKDEVSRLTMNHTRSTVYGSTAHGTGAGGAWCPRK